ncbi:hypothetical protein KW791_02590 [Candidatus Parcubacteria bacterium]|nr:hypothetical protein [Candidatus Parcubacteria bacterium]
MRYGKIALIGIGVACQMGALYAGLHDHNIAGTMSLGLTAFGTMLVAALSESLTQSF